MEVLLCLSDVRKSLEAEGQVTKSVYWSYSSILWLQVVAGICALFPEAVPSPI